MKPAPAPSLPRPTAVLWDLDGTLIDQTAAIVRCFAEVIERMAGERPKTDRILRSLGGPMRSTMALFIDEPHLDAAEQAFRQRFPEIMFDGLVVLPGGPELIESLHRSRIPQALYTNKHGATARRVSRYAGFARYVPVCVGHGDTEWHKPQPELTRHVLAQIRAVAAGACLIGDSPTDVETARNAGLNCYTVSTGAHHREELEAAGASAAFGSLIELQAAFAQALGEGPVA